jgi:subtilisin
MIRAMDRLSPGFYSCLTISPTKESTVKLKFQLSTILILAVIAAITFTAAPSQAASGAKPYIIVFKDSVDVPASVPAVAQAYGLQPGFIYQHALKGFSAQVPDGRLVALQKDPRVAYVVEDYVRTVDAQTLPTGIQRIFANTNPAIDIDGSDDFRVDVDVAVIDTGIDFQHPELDVQGGVNCTVDRVFTTCYDGGDDDHYHGTHVAGTIGALDNGDGVVGVAPGARLWAVKVLNKRGSGYSSWIIGGIDWVTANAATIEVANMSLGGAGFSQAEYDAIQGAVNAGVAFAVSAGNEDDDANNYSPGGFDNVLSVSALVDYDGLPGGFGAPTCFSDQDDTLAYFSNWGPEVDIAAPGGCILSTYPLEKGSYGTISGTSMASPHVAGALALLASANNPVNATDVYALYDQVVDEGNFDWTDDSGDGIKEPLLDVTGFPARLVATGGTGNTPPSVSISSPVDGATFESGATVSFSGTASDVEDGSLSSSLDGQIGTGTSFSAVLSVGVHTVTASVTDAGGLSGSDSVTVTVSSGGTGGTITVALAGSSSTINKNFWRATVTATVNSALPGAVVSGAWSTGATASCTTDTAGKCSVTVSLSTKSVSSVTYTVSGVALTGYTYVPGVTSVTVLKP